MSVIEQSSSLSGAPSLEKSTLAAVMLETIGRRGDAVALRTHDGAVELSFSEFGERVRRIAAGLVALGVRRGDAVALMLRNCVEFHLVDAAAMCIGAVPFSLYNTSPAEQLGYIMGNAGNRIVITEPRFADLIADAARYGAQYSTVVLTAPLPGGTDGGAVLLSQLEERGDDGFDLAQAAGLVKPDDLLTIIYTSGTTGQPKGVETTHASMLAELRGTHRAVALPEGGRTVSFLPAAHVADRWASHYAALMTYGYEVTVLDDPTKLFEVTAALHPSSFGGVPRIWDKLKSAITSAAGGADMASLARSDNSIGPAIRARLGLDKSMWFVSGAAGTSIATLEFFDALGVPICEIWGMSETSGVATANTPSDHRYGSVGRAIDGVALRLADDGELLVRGDTVMRGYRALPELTAESIDQDGWLHTGDVATVDDDGYVSIVDRKKEMLINAAGKNMSPTHIESRLTGVGPLIGQAVVIGDDRPFNVALLVLDPEGSAGLDPADSAVLARIQAEVDAANTMLSRPEQIKKFHLLLTEWLPGGDELTPTMKPKRKAIAAKYSAEIGDLYA